MEKNLICCHIKSGLAGMPLSIEKELYHGLPIPTISLDFAKDAPIQNQISHLNNAKQKNLNGNRLSDYQKAILNEWITNNFNHPYPSNSQKIELMRLTGLTRHRLNVWFTNHRIRGNYAFRLRKFDSLIFTNELISQKTQLKTINASQKQQHSIYSTNINQPISPTQIIISPPILPIEIAGEKRNQVHFAFPYNSQ